MPTTTRCCSAVALTILIVRAVLSAQAPPPLVPSQIYWTKLAEASLSAPPALDRDAAFLPLASGRIEKHELIAGERLWSIERSARSRPATADGLLFFEESGAIAAVSDGDGSPKWRVALEDFLAAPLLADHGWLVAGTTTGDVLCLRASSGEVLWRRPLGAPLRASPAINGDRLYLPLVDRVVALALADGRSLWERRLGGPSNDLLALDTRVYVGSDDNYFYALDPKDGRVTWRFRTGGDVIGVPLVDAERIYFVARDNVIRALDRKSGNQHWRRQLPVRPAYSPVFAGDAVLVSGAVSSMYLFTVKDGTAVGSIQAEAPLAAAPLVTGGASLRVVATTNDVLKGAMLTAFGPKAPATPSPDDAPAGLPGNSAAPATIPGTPMTRPPG